MSRVTCRSVCLLAPAKVNLFLEVLGKRLDGFHDIETFMVAIDLCDRLEFERDDSGIIAIASDDPAVPIGPENLIWRAAESLRRLTGCRWGVRVRLTKRIPMQAGLAGGSTDAAATLKGLNRLWDLGCTTEDLTRLGAELGSDVPFFFAPGAAWCTGRGDIVEPWRLPRPIHLVVVCPGFGLSTPTVFRHVRVPESPKSSREMRRALEAGDIEMMGRSLYNRLQESAETLAPSIRHWLDRLRGESPAGCLMSGSGSAVVALCRDRNEAMRVARSLRADVADRRTSEQEASRPPAQEAGSYAQIHVVRSCP